MEIINKIINNNKNILVSGELASGKTANVLFPVVDEIINNKENIFINDPKEEYINCYYNKLKENGYSVHVINLRDLTKSESWNPFLYPYKLYKSGNKDLAQDLIDKITKKVFYDEESRDPFWSDSASDFATGCILGLFDDAKEEEINFNSLAKLIEGVGTIGTYIFSPTKKYFDIKGDCPASLCVANTINAPTDTKSSIMSVVNLKIRSYISRERLAKLLSRSSFNFEELLNKPTAYILVGKDENKALNDILAMFIEQLFTFLVSNKSNNKFNYILDNIDIINNINGLSDMMASGLPRGIKFYLGTRDVELLLNTYGNYIKNLVDQVYLKANTIETTINGEEIVESKESVAIKYTEDITDLPVLDESEVKVFDLNDFLSAYPLPSYDKSNNINIDDLIKKIDDKIAEIDKAQEDINKNEE